MHAAQPSLSVAQQNSRKPDAYLTFCHSRSNGVSVTASARAAGISRVTGSRYEALRIQAVEQENRILDAEGRIATRNQLAEKLTKALQEAEPQYIAPIASSLSRVMGYDAPTRSQVEIRSVPASVEAWMDSLLTIDVSAEQRQELPPAQPKALMDKASSDSSS